LRLASLTVTVIINEYHASAERELLQCVSWVKLWFGEYEVARVSAETRDNSVIRNLSTEAKLSPFKQIPLK